MLVGVNPHYISDAKQVVYDAPDLAPQMRDGSLTLPKAKQRVRRRKTIAAAAKNAEEMPLSALVTLARWEDWLDGQSECDLLLTDPPYSTDIEDIVAFVQSWLPAALAKVRPSGRAYVCIGAYPDELRAYLGTSVPEHLILSQVLVWTYRNTLGPAPKFDYKQNWQAVLYFKGIEASPLDCPEMTEQFSVADINAPDGRMGDRWHAWQKPDQLAERFVRHATKPGDLVLDPFAGTGTFILAAARLGRRAFGCEPDPEVLRMAQERGCQVAG